MIRYRTTGIVISKRRYWGFKYFHVYVRDIGDVDQRSLVSRYHAVVRDTCGVLRQQIVNLAVIQQYIVLFKNISWWLLILSYVKKLLPIRILDI